MVHRYLRQASAFLLPASACSVFLRVGCRNRLSASLVMPQLLMRSWPCTGTMQPLPTEPVTFPALCLAGRLPEQQNATVNLDLTHAQVGGMHPMN